jgi:RluA family pseudouridine synthase
MQTMERLELTVAPAQAGRTVGSLLRRELSMADGLISSVKFREDGILLNGRPARVTAHVAAGDVLTVRIADTGRNTAMPLDLPLPILWEDDSLAVIDKPAGVGVYGEGTPNIAGILANMWGDSIEFHPVNRLDVGTTGLMVAAKDGYAHDRLRRLLHTDDFRREYLAVAEGIVVPDAGTIDLPISRDPVEGARRTVDPDGLPSRTDYEVLAVRGGRSLLRLRLHTGRTHQIRVHMAAVGHPLVGDPLYGTPSPDISRPALHSHRLVLRHPITGQLLDITSPPPEDMERLMNQ